MSATLDEDEAASTGGSPARAGAKLLTSLATAALFFGLVAPVGIVMRFAGRDRLRLRRNPGRASYWILRSVTSGRPTAMTRQT